MHSSASARRPVTLHRIEDPQAPLVRAPEASWEKGSHFKRGPLQGRSRASPVTVTTVTIITRASELHTETMFRVDRRGRPKSMEIRFSAQMLPPLSSHELTRTCYWRAADGHSRRRGAPGHRSGRLAMARARAAPVVRSSIMHSSASAKRPITLHRT